MFFHRINADLCGNITVSMLTLFRVATFEGMTPTGTVLTGVVAMAK